WGGGVGGGGGVGVVGGVREVTREQGGEVGQGRGGVVRGRTWEDDGRERRSGRRGDGGEGMGE
ncbi:hypothetical protein HGQ98_22720, partial [Achromobacter ruhlandii]